MKFKNLKNQEFKSIKNLTEFEKKVLAQAKKIPHGKVATYGEVARAIGHPRAARAVGNALNKNPWPIKIPCHRVIKSDGEIGGYVSGKNNKMKLLCKEGVVINEKCKINYE
jgi:methylated-DNA-[protein]-cysteine S-methyltransferase